MEISDGNPKLNKLIVELFTSDKARTWPRRPLTPSTCFKNHRGETWGESEYERELYRRSSTDRHQSGTCWSSASGMVVYEHPVPDNFSLSAALEKLFSLTHTHTHWRGEPLTNTQTVEEAEFTYSSKAAATVPPSKKTEYPELLCRVNKRL